MNIVPKKVKLGIGFCGAAVAIQLFGLLHILTMDLPVGYRDISPTYADAVSALSISVVIGVMLIIFMSMRHNWARIIYAVLFGVGILFLLATSKTPNIVMLMEAVGLIFLYTKDSTMWFKTEPNEQ